MHPSGRHFHHQASTSPPTLPPHLENCMLHISCSYRFKGETRRQRSILLMLPILFQYTSNGCRGSSQYIQVWAVPRSHINAVCILRIATITIFECCNGAGHHSTLVPFWPCLPFISVVYNGLIPDCLPVITSDAVCFDYNASYRGNAGCDQ